MYINNARLFLGLFVEAQLSSGKSIEGTFTDYENGVLYIGGDSYSVDEIAELYGIGDVVHYNPKFKLGFFGMKDQESVSFKANNFFFKDNPDITEEDLFYGEHELRFRYIIDKRSIGKKYRVAWNPKLVYKRKKLLTRPYAKYGFLYVFEDATLYGVLDKYDSDNFSLVGDEKVYSRYGLINVVALPRQKDKTELHTRDGQVIKGIVSAVDSERKCIVMHDGYKVPFETITRVIRFGYLPSGDSKYMVLPAELSHTGISIYHALIWPSFPSTRGEVSYETYADSTSQVLWNAKNVTPVGEEGQDYGRVESLDDEGGTIVSVRGERVGEEFRFSPADVLYGSAYIGANLFFTPSKGTIRTASDIFVLSAPPTDTLPSTANDVDAPAKIDVEIPSWPELEGSESDNVVAPINEDALKIAETFVEGETFFYETPDVSVFMAGEFVRYDREKHEILYRSLAKGVENVLRLAYGITLWRVGRITALMGKTGVIDNKQHFDLSAVTSSLLRHILTSLRTPESLCMYTFTKASGVQVSFPSPDAENAIPWKEGVVSGPYSSQSFLIDNRVVCDKARFSAVPSTLSLYRDGGFVGLGYRVFYRGVKRLDYKRGLVEEAVSVTTASIQGRFPDKTTFATIHLRSNVFVVTPQVAKQVQDFDLIDKPVFVDLALSKSGAYCLDVTAIQQPFGRQRSVNFRMLYGYVQDYDPNTKTLKIAAELSGLESIFDVKLDEVLTNLDVGDIRPESHWRIAALQTHLDTNPKIEEVYLSAERGQNEDVDYQAIIDENKVLLDCEAFDLQERAKAFFYLTDEGLQFFCKDKDKNPDDCYSGALLALGFDDLGNPKAAFIEQRRSFRSAIRNLYLFFSSKSSDDVIERMKDFRNELGKEQWLHPGLLLDKDFEFLSSIRSGCDLIRDAERQSLANLKNALFRFSCLKDADTDLPFLKQAMDGLSKNLLSYVNDIYLKEYAPRLAIAWCRLHENGVLISITNEGTREARNVEISIPVYRNPDVPGAGSFKVEGEAGSILPGRDCEFFIDFQGNTPPEKLRIDLKYLSVASVDHKGDENLTTETVKDEFLLNQQSESFEPIRVNRYNDISDLRGVQATDHNESMFFGREKLITKLIEANLDSNGELVAGRSFAVWGQYRCGKTSVAKFLIKRIRERFPDTFTIYCDFNNVRSFDGLETMLLTEIQNQIIADESLRKLFKKEINFGEGNKHNFGDQALMTFESFARLVSLNKNLQKYHIVVILDEFTYLIDKIKSGDLRTDFIIQWDSMCQRCGVNYFLFGHEEMNRFWTDSSLFGGDVKTINVLSKVRKEAMPYLSYDDAVTMMERPLLCSDGRSRFLPENRQETIDYIFSLTAGSPFYLMLLMRALTNYLMSKNITAVYRRVVEDVVKNYLFYSMEGDRIEEDMFHPLWSGPDDEQIQRILQQTAALQNKTPDSGALVSDIVDAIGESRSETLAFIRRMLNARKLFYTELTVRSVESGNVMTNVSDSALLRRHVSISVGLYCEYIKEMTASFDDDWN